MRLWGSMSWNGVSARPSRAENKWLTGLESGTTRIAQAPQETWARQSMESMFSIIAVEWAVLRSRDPARIRAMSMYFRLAICLFIL